MATVFKRRRRRPIPPGATLKTFRGKQVAEWTDGRGDKQRASLAEDGQAVMVEAEYYSVEYFDQNGERKREATRIADKDAARQYANELEKQTDLRRKGYIDARQEKLTTEGRRTVAEALADFRAKMTAAGRDSQHVTTTIGYIEKVSEAADFGTIGDIAADPVNCYAEDLGQRRSARTVQAYLTAMKGFTRWLAQEGKLPADPLASVRKPSPKTDRRRERRMLLPDEWKWLRSVTLAEAEERYGMTASERVLLYATAVQTGLRSSELRSLTRRRLFLESEQPYITCAAGSTKNKRDARQYVQPELAAELRDHVARKAPAAPVFAMPPKEDVAGMLRADLAGARREWIKAARHNPQERAKRAESDFLTAENHEGEVLDFHSLRHSTGAWLAMNGAHPKAVQAVMRHSTITLTMDTYGHLFPGQESETVARLPAMLADSTETLAATGTDDATADLGENRGQQIGQQYGGKTGQRVATTGEEVGQEETDETADKPEPQVLALSRNDKRRRVTATAGEERRARDSNPQPVARHLISSQAASQFAYPPAATS